MWQRQLGNAATRIGDGDANAFSPLSRPFMRAHHANAKAATVFHCFHCIQDEIGNQLPQLAGKAEYLKAIYLRMD